MRAIENSASARRVRFRGRRGFRVALLAVMASPNYPLHGNISVFLDDR